MQGYVDAVADWHKRHGAHGAITPAAFDVDASGRVTLRPPDEGLESPTEIYMAPERLRGKRPSKRADIFSLGAVLYQVRTGHPPFSAPTRAEALERVLHGPVPVLADDDEWARLINRCLKRSGDRSGDTRLNPNCSSSGSVGCRRICRRISDPKVIAAAIVVLAVVTSVWIAFSKAPTVATAAPTRHVRASRLVEELLHGKDCARRRAAAKRLGASGGHDAVEALKTVQARVERDPDERSCIRGAARKALKRLAH